MINLIDFSKIKTGVALHNTVGKYYDEFIQDEKYATYMELVPVCQDTVLYVHKKWTGVCFYDTNKKFIVNHQTRADDEAVTVPDGVRYFSIYKMFAVNEDFTQWTVYINSLTDNYFISRKDFPNWIYQNITNLKTNYITYNKLKNINWCPVGDSLTDSKTLESTDGKLNYVDYVVNVLGMNVTNMGVAGTGFVTNNSGYGTTFVERIDSIPENTHLVTVFGSFNDYDNIDEHLGSFGDTTNDTIYGSMYLFFTNLFKKFPLIHVGCITPTPWGYLHGTSINSIDIKSDLYVEALCKTAQYFNVPILDLYHESGLRPWDKTFADEYFRDDSGDGIANTVHPLQEAHKKFIAPLVIDFIKKIYNIF